MDDLDRRLLGLLDSDGRAPVKTLAATLGVSRATVQARLSRLQASGAVLGFTVRLGQPVQAAPVRAMISIATDHARPEQMLAAIRRLPDIARVHTTNGEWDLIAEVACGDLGALDRLIDAMRTTRGVVRTQTLLLLTSYAPTG